MATVPGQTSTTSAPAYIGTLRQFKRRPNAVLKMIGGLNADNTVSGNGWRREANYKYATSVDYDLPAPAQPANLEGAAAPAATTAANSQSTNVIQLFHEQVDISYLKASTYARFTGVQTAGETPEQAAQAFQISRKLEKVAQDANYSFLRGVYAEPADPTASPLKTRGLLTCMVTNVLANGGTPRAITKALLASLYKAMIDNAGTQPENLISVLNTNQMGAISALYETQFNQGQQRDVGGVMVRQIFTAFGVLNLTLDLDMPQDQIAFINPGLIQGVFVDVPQKPAGLFYEELSRSGSSVKGQLYGQMGIDHGAEWGHGLLKDLS